MKFSKFFKLQSHLKAPLSSTLPNSMIQQLRDLDELKQWDGNQSRNEKKRKKEEKKKRREKEGFFFHLVTKNCHLDFVCEVLGLFFGATGLHKKKKEKKKTELKRELTS